MLVLEKRVFRSARSSAPLRGRRSCSSGPRSAKLRTPEPDKNSQKRYETSRSDGDRAPEHARRPADGRGDACRISSPPTPVHCAAGGRDLGDDAGPRGEEIRHAAAVAQNGEASTTAGANPGARRPAPSPERRAGASDSGVRSLNSGVRSDELRGPEAGVGPELARSLPGACPELGRSLAGAWPESEAPGTEWGPCRSESRS